ncbi:uncharacterized protein [Primulina huaijiensis]|uniref:uncharacterized protein n=1 Tax=Primulina huaijiensis TaxID=1492673 RepID=UPI003CC71C3E
MIIAMTVKNKLGFLDGSIAKPADTDSNFSSWIRNNNIVIAWILNSVSKDISASILFADSAAEIWNDLRERFQQSNGPRIFQLRRELINLRQDQQSVAVYFTKLKSVWDELSNFRPSCTCGQCTCGGVKELAVFSHHEYVLTFLLGLNESFTQIRGQLLLLDPLPPINKVFSLVSQEERQRSISSQSGPNTSPSDNLAFVAVKGSKSSGPDLGARTRSVQRERPFCTKCQIHGHTIDTCYKIHGYPPGYKPKYKPRFDNVATHFPAANVAVNHVVNNDSPSAPQDSHFFQSLSPGQYQQLMKMFATHLPASVSTESSPMVGSSFSTGDAIPEDDWQG